MSTIKNVVLVHGSFVDGSGWEGVFHLLTRRGYNVSVVQNPTTTLEADLAATRNILDEQDGDVVLVGHSYGGVVISEAGNHPKVKRLVYVTAFAADAGESVASLIANPPPGATAPPILPPKNGFLLLDQSKFVAAFAADVEPGKAAFMAKSQVPWGVESLQGAVTKPAWKTKPSFYLVATADGMIPPPAQRTMAQRARATVREVAASHAVCVSKPGVVAEIIEAAAEA
jgi:pimeloyl-ACP methyl ester carboxylesterase